MAIGITNVTSGVDADGGSASTTASVSPTSNNLLLLSVTSRTGITAEPNQPTVTGLNLTWVVIGTNIYWDTDSSSRKKTTLFRALGTVTNGTIAIDFGGQNQTNVIWSLEQVSGIDTSGTNGSGAIVQSATNKDEVTGGGTLTVTLAAFGSANNATYGTFASDSALTVTDFTELSNNTSSFNHTAIYKLANDTTVVENYATQASSKIGGIAIEIQNAVASTSVKQLAALGVG